MVLCLLIYTGIGTPRIPKEGARRVDSGRLPTPMCRKQWNRRTSDYLLTGAILSNNNEVQGDFLP